MSSIRKRFWNRWRLVYDVYRLSQEETSSPLMRLAITHAIQRNLLVYVRAAITHRPQHEAIEALECVTELIRAVEKDCTLLHIILSATLLTPGCVQVLAKMIEHPDDRVALTAFWSLHEMIRLGDPRMVTELMGGRASERTALDYDTFVQGFNEHLEISQR
jgi:hypothetical protein